MARSERFNVEIGATDNASSTIDEVAGKVEALPSQATVELEADDQATEDIEQVTEGVENLDGSSAEVELGAEDEATEIVEELTTGVEDLDGTSADVEISATDSASGEIAAVEEALATLETASAHPDITIEGDDASSVTDVFDALGDLEGEEANADVNVTGVDEASGGLSSIMDNLGVLSLGALTAAAGGALTSVFTGAADHVLEVQGLAEATGATLEDASALDEAFDFVGVSTQQLQGFIGRVNDKLRESPELAEQLGVKYDENQTPLQTFVDAVEALNSGQLTANERLSLAIDLFGRKGALSILALDTQVGDLSDAMANIPEWQVITQSDVDSAIGFKETMDELGDLAAEAGQVFLTTLAPAIREAFEIAEDVGGAVNTIAQFGQEGTPKSVWDFIDSFPTDQFNTIIDDLDKLGVSAEELGDDYFHLAETQALLDVGIPPSIIAGSELTAQAFDLLIDTMADVPEVADALRTAFDKGQISQREWDQMMRDNVISIQEVEAAIDDADVAVQEGTTTLAARAEAEEVAAEATERLTEQLNGQIAALQGNIDKNNELAGILADSGDVWLDQRDAVRDAEQAVADYTEAMQPVEDETRTQEEILRDQEAALDDVVGSYERVADGAVETARATAEAEGATLSDVEALDVHNQSLLDNAATLDGPMQQALLAHILRINGIPEERITEILTDTNPDDLAQVETELKHASRTREALVKVEEDADSIAELEAHLDLLDDPRTVTYYTRTVATTSGGSVLPRQHGTSHSEHGTLLVGETGPELVQLPIGSEIMTHARTLEALRAGRAGGGGGNTYVTNTIHLPAGTRPRDVLRAERLWARRNGEAS